MRVKPYVVAFLCLMLLTGAASASNAETAFSRLQDAPESAEIEALIPTILPELNEIAELSALEPVTADEIHLEDAYPYYTNDNYFAPEIQDAQDFLSRIQSQEHPLWILTIPRGEKTMVAAMGRSYDTGSWEMSWVKVYPSGTDWKTAALAQDLDADQIVLVNGLAQTNSVMAVCIQDDALTDVVAVSDAAFSLSPDSVPMLGAEQDGSVTISVGDRFPYQALQETLGVLTPTDEGDFTAGGGASFTAGTDAAKDVSPARHLPWVVISAIVLLGGAAAIYHAVKK